MSQTAARRTARRGGSERRRIQLLILRGDVLVERLVALFTSAANHLFHAARVASRTDRRAALDAGAARAFDAASLAGPGGAFLEAAAFAEALRDSVTLALRHAIANDDIV